jgi:Na+-transporting NADH:ubiquinone oxidoreductase subunit C
MAFDKNTNQFTFIFAAILVSVVGVLLAMTYIGLKPSYEENVRREKMQNILAAMNIEVDRDKAPELFGTTITGSLLVDHSGNRIPGSDTSKSVENGAAFKTDVLMQYKSVKAREITAEQVRYPVYIGMAEGRELYVFPMVGTGLWGPVWGYVAVESDGRTIYGSTFDHKGETPGLGAEIATPIFEDQFKGKTITTEAGEFRGITVYKGGSNTNDPHGVDGITGGTITSKGVEEMLIRTLEVYTNYLRTVVGGGATTEQAVPIIPMDTLKQLGLHDAPEINTVEQ